MLFIILFYKLDYWEIMSFMTLQKTMTTKNFEYLNSAKSRTYQSNLEILHLLCMNGLFFFT